MGAGALSSNLTGTENTATGLEALLNNTDGGANTATGVQALGNNTTGELNTANGQLALSSNTIGGENTADGESALTNNTIGSGNTAVGLSALRSNTTGGSNIALGEFAGGRVEGHADVADQVERAEVDQALVCAQREPFAVLPGGDLRHGPGLALRVPVFGERFEAPSAVRVVVADSKFRVALAGLAIAHPIDADGDASGANLFWPGAGQL